MESSVRTLRRVQVVGALVPALLLGVMTAPALGSTGPVITGLGAQVANRAALLSWSAGGSGTAVACVVPPAESVSREDCVRRLPVEGLRAKDASFTNTQSVSYAVWAVNADGTASEQPARVTVAPVAPVVTALTLARSAGSVRFGRPVTLTARLTRAGVPLANEAVQVHASVVGSGTSSVVRRLVTSANGTVRAALLPNRSTRYTVRFAGTAFSRPAASPGTSVIVLPRVRLALTRTVVGPGQTAYAVGQLRPASAGVPFVVQRRVQGAWRGLKQGRTTSTGGFRTAVQPGTGTHALRVVVARQVALGPVTSAPVSLTVYPRRLSQGMSGRDVLALQRFLAARRYDPGAVDGSYGYSTVHAVMAFQKVERLPATGRWGRAERTRSARPTAWKLRYPRTGRAVEVSITRQVLVLSEGGRVRRIIDISSGNGEPYLSRGVRVRAHTPRGHFRIYRKINGLRISHLGGLWKPSYFHRGWAIHGSPSVPAYPASHGCVRITNPNANRIFPLLTHGTPVTVYDE